MLVDPYDARWLDRLGASDGGTAETGATYLLIDGVFIPGLHRRFKAVMPSTLMPSLLFEGIPSCSDRTRDVSPFLVPFQSANSRFVALLRECSGWPMICAIETAESQGELTERLAAWCVVEVDGQRFNFRFPDTRRLPAIFCALSADQLGACAPERFFSDTRRDLMELLMLNSMQNGCRWLERSVAAPCGTVLPAICTFSATKRRIIYSFAVNLMRRTQVSTRRGPCSDHAN